MDTKLIICDTNIFINWYQNDNATVEKLLEIGAENIIIPSIVKMELLVGSRNKKELLLMKTKIKKYPVIHINEAISQKASEYIEKFQLSNKLQIPDALIAATAVVYKLSLFTYNLKDFKFIPNIKLY